MAASVDAGYVSAFLQIPESSITSVLNAPTVELVQAVLQAVASKAHEFEDAQADKLRLEIELENAIRRSDTQAQSLKASVDKALEETNTIRIRLNQEESARSTLENELQNIRSSSTSSSAEVQSLRARISSLEATNRETIAIVESKSAANDVLAQDLTKQHEKGMELTKHITTLQQQLQTANSAVSSAKFRQQSTSQELEQAKRNNEWLDTELKNKSAEALKLRKEKGARIAELQRLVEDTTANVDALKKTETALRTRLDEVQRKAEDSLEQVQRLQEAAARAEEDFRQELVGSQRLADLRAQQTETHRSRLEEVEASMEKFKEEVQEDLDRCQQELDSERRDREAGDNRIAELEAEIDQLESTLSRSQNASGSARATPQPETPRSSLNVAGRSGSPFATPGSVRGRTTITATQALEELYKTKGLLSSEKRRSERLTAELEEMMAGLEAKQPEFEEMQAEHNRLQQEIVEMSKFVDQSGKEAERAKKLAKKSENETATARTEAGILTQQLNDLSTQVKMLLFDMEVRDRGLDAMSPEERRQMERLVRGEVAEGALEGLSDTDRLISERMVIFRSVDELQQKNQDLLKITRELGAQMESEEALAAKHQAAADHEEVQALQQKVEGYKEELRSMLTRSDSYIKERDMFRRMLQHRGQLPQNDDSSMFDRSINQDSMRSSTNQNGNTEDAAAVIALRELQRHFDQYREEQSVDRRSLKEQSEKLAQDKASLQAEIAKISSQLTLATERYEMLQANYNMLRNENTELQKRSQVLAESAAKQDLKTQQVAEDLIESRGLVESMRNETANLKAEKDLWKKIQDRLSQDNDDLSNERSRLNGVIATQQTMQNERELAENENRRRLQAQVEALETELSTTKRKLNDEVEENKKAQLRKEYDTQQNQKRIDDLAGSLSSIKEELAVTKNTRDHLQARVDELTIELRSAEERVTLLHPRPTPRPGARETAATNDNASEEHEQALAIEVSELRRDLELAHVELESAKVQVEQYKSIAQAAEEELQSFNETHDQYREEMDRLLLEKDTKVAELLRRIEDISAELSTANVELNTLRDQQSEAARHRAEETATFDSEMARLREESEKHAAAAQFHQQDLRTQAEIATKAQQDYEDELVKHASATQSLHALRNDYNVVKTEAAEFKAEAESARTTLQQSQTSWEERKEQFERELADLRGRRDDATSQNKILLQQMDDINAQIASLQQTRTATDESQAAEHVPADRSIDGLRELITYLRRDKEIVDVQYELSIQEAKRLRQQLEYTQSQLDDTKLKLDQERRSQADGSRSTMAHKDLMEKLNELNLFRESSITLRNESRQAQTQLAEMTQRCEELLAQIQPLETKLREAESNKEMQDGEIRLLQEDRDRWQKRNQEILSKYDRIDPAEMEQLKQSVTTLTIERDMLMAERAPLNEKLEALEAEKVAWGQARIKIIESAKERVKKDRADRAAERELIVQAKDLLERELATANEKSEKLIEEKQSIEQKLNEVQEELSSAHAKSAAEPSQPPPHDEELNVKLEEIRQELSQAIQARESTEQEVNTIRQELDSARSDRDKALAEVAQLTSQLAARPQVPETDATNGEAQVNDNSVEEGQVVETEKSELADAERKALEERIATAEATAQAAEERLKQIEASQETVLKARSDKMKKAINEKLQASRAAQTAALVEEYGRKFEHDKQAWIAEHATTSEPEQTNDAKVEEAAATIPEDASAVVAEPETAAATESSQTPATPSAPSAPSATPAAPSTPIDLTKLGADDVRTLLSSNATVKEIVANNIKKKLAIETQKIKDEYEKTTAEKLAEAATKAENAKQSAVAMAGKKTSLQLNMATNQSKIAKHKIALVETAAKETPQKPVIEVWDVIKNAQPPPITPATAPPVAPPATPIQKPSAGNSAEPAQTSDQVASSTTSAPASPAVTATEANKPAIPTNGQPAATNNTQPAQPTAPRTGIPVPRGGGVAHRGRGNFNNQAGRGLYQARGGARGGLQVAGRGQGHSPNTGEKRPHDGGANGGPAGQKRQRGGGPAS